MLKQMASMAISSALVVLAGVLYATSTPAAQAPDSQRVQVAVAYKVGASAAVHAAIVRAGGTVVAEMAEVNAVAANLSRRGVDTLKRTANVTFVEAGITRHILGSVGPGRATLAVAGQVMPYGITLVQSDQVSDALASGRKLCIVDSGIDATHEDLNSIPLTGENLTTSGTAFTDEAQHGTHVAGTVAALDNALGVVGVAPNGRLNLHIAKVFDASGSASSITIARGMLSCLRNGANVVSMSLGGSGSSRIEELVVNAMAKRNILLIAAAGNAGTSAISYPAGFANVVSVAAIDSNMDWATFSQFNADVEIAGPGVDVLSSVPMGGGREALVSVNGTPYVVQPVEGTPTGNVTAALADFGLGDVTDPGMAGKVCLVARGNIAFSDKVLNCQASGGVAVVIYNNTAGALLATLGGVVTTIPSVGALQADGAAMLAQLGQSATVNVASSNYAVFSGTSMSTPHVSAVAALVWSHYTSCTAAQMRNSLNKSAMDLGTAGRDVNFGYGVVQAKAAFDRIAVLGCGN